MKPLSSIIQECVNLWIRASNFGLDYVKDRKSNNRSVRNVRICNQLAFFMGSLAFVYTFVWLYHGSLVLSLMNILSAFAFGIVLCMQHQGRFEASKVAIIVSFKIF